MSRHIDVAVVACALASGGATGTMLVESVHQGQVPPPFGGTGIDVLFIASPLTGSFGSYPLNRGTCCLLACACAIDLPMSLAADTVLSPVTVPYFFLMGHHRAAPVVRPKPNEGGDTFPAETLAYYDELATRIVQADAPLTPAPAGGDDTPSPPRR